MMVNIEDARRAARRKLPKILFDYIDGGAFSETTMRVNESDFERYALKQRVLVDVRERDLSTSFLGQRHSLPFGLGPVGYSGLMARGGELAAARAAEMMGIPFCLSNFGIATIGEVRKATAGPLYMQLYILQDRSVMEAILAACEAAGVTTLVLTVDTAITPVRERDLRNGFRELTRVTPSLAMQLMMKPRWCARVLSGGLPRIGSIEGRAEYGWGVLEQSRNLARQIEQSLTWNDLDWLRERWKGHLVIKGVLSVEDARLAVAAGADAIVVSNHGGRQLDGAQSTIAILPEVAQAVGGDIEILFDGGIRRGTHIVKALALGADGVLLGRAYAYGLAAGGQAGVAAIIDLLRNEIDQTMALMGVTSVAQLRSEGATRVTDNWKAHTP
jgi:isopentenyl diphosphate isomerase/L-lactate dehydrogenase-like FMN-dependent dehydrogenase